MSLGDLHDIVLRSENGVGSDEDVMKVLPEWFCDDGNIMVEQYSVYHRVYLSLVAPNRWFAVVRRRNGLEELSKPLPNFLNTYESFVDSGNIIPSWHNFSLLTNCHGRACHVSTDSLVDPCPRSLASAIETSFPDASTWHV